MRSSTLIFAALPILALASPVASPEPQSSPAIQIATAANTPEEQDEASNNAQQSCSGPQGNEQCQSYCKKQLPNLPDLGITCLEEAAPGQGPATNGVCKCYNGQPIADLIIDFGQVLCVVVNDIVNTVVEVTEDVAQVASVFLAPEALPEEAAADAAEDGLFQLGKNVVKKGAKACGTPKINACPGETYTVINPSDKSTSNSVVSCSH